MINWLFQNPFSFSSNEYPTLWVGAKKINKKIKCNLCKAASNSRSCKKIISEHMRKYIFHIFVFLFLSYKRNVIQSSFNNLSQSPQTLTQQIRCIQNYTFNKPIYHQQWMWMHIAHHHSKSKKAWMWKLNINGCHAVASDPWLILKMVLCLRTARMKNRIMSKYM